MEPHVQPHRHNVDEMCGRASHSRCHRPPWRGHHCPELVSDISISPSKIPQMRRLMRMLAQSGFFCRNQNEHSSAEEGSYSLTPISNLLTGEGSLSGFLLAMLHPVIVDPFKSMTNWFKTTTFTTTCPFEVAHDCAFWEKTERDEGFNTAFNAGMASDSKFLMELILGNHGGVFEGLESLVDVGGGTGEVVMAIKAAFPEVKCSVLELKHVVDAVGNVKNVEFIEGDMFEFVPSANSVLLKWILHDWSDEDCVKILRKCKEAIMPWKENGGKIIIIDLVVGDDDNLLDQKSRTTQMYWDMMMMVLLGGTERTEKEWKKLFDEAGFEEYKITPVGLRSVIELFP